MKFNLPKSSRNWISISGAMIALVSLFMIVFLFVITSLTRNQASYLGLVIYILLPAIMIFGLILIPAGMIYKSRSKNYKEKAGDINWPAIDLNKARHRNAFFIFMIGTALFLFLSAIGSYHAFRFTESVEFCGTLCHEVMKPEYTAYQNSPHARVACVYCHVGAGADWYVRSKLSGLYQVYAVLADNFPRPIPTPISNLRPARETCEECHWPQKFYSKSLRIERHYLSNKKNTPWDIHLNLKTGPDYSALGLTEGIHWHINPDVKIEYYAADKKNLEIPWVRYSNRRTGERTVYRNEENKINDNEIDSADIQTMDCMDCHNRPSHSYEPPSGFIDNLMTAGIIPDDLPGIKSIALEACAVDYKTTGNALKSIEESIRQYYAREYPHIVTSGQWKIDRAVKGVQQGFSENIFPEMKAKWNVYPDHIGHVEFDGCFRCHNNSHRSGTGRTIGMDCNRCHVIVAQGNPAKMVNAVYGSSLEFRHPVDTGGMWKESLCTDCHTGLNP